MSFLLNVNQVFLTRAALYAVAFLLSVIIARALGPDGRGLYSLFFLVVSVTTSLAGLGVGLGNIYFLGKGRYERRVLLGNSHLLVLVVAALTTLVMVAYALAFQPRAFVDSPAYWLYAPASTLLLYFVVMTTFLQGDSRFTAMNALTLVQSLLVLVVAAALFYVDRLTIFTLLLAGTASLAATDLLALLVVGLHYLDLRAVLRPRWDALRDQVSFGIKGQIADLAQLFNYRLDTFLVAAFVGTAQVGHYAVAVGLSETVWWLSNAVSTVLLPRLTRAGEREAAALTAVLCRNIMFISAVGAAVLALLASLVVKGVFGQAFAPAVEPIYWLLPGVVALSGNKVIASYIFSRGRVILNTYDAFIALAATLAFDLLLIPRFGVPGAAMASSIAYGTSLVVAVYWYGRVFGNNVWEVLLPRSSDLHLYLEVFRRLRARYVPLGRP